MSARPGPSERLDRQVGRSAFGTDALGYHEARSGYPPELFDYLARRTAPAPRILEIGAGTGLASAGLLACSPSRLTLVEPDPRLCAFLEERFAQANVCVASGTFPEIQIEGPFDLAACAAAFHWMEAGPALARVRSLLVPGGTWAMWWNCYFGHGEEDVLAERVKHLLEEEGISLPPSYQGFDHYALDVPKQTELLRDAGFRDIGHKLFRTSREFDALQARNLYQSFSFIRVLAQGVQTRILDCISQVVDTELDGRASSVVVTSLFAASN